MKKVKSAGKKKPVKKPRSTGGKAPSCNCGRDFEQRVAASPAIKSLREEVKGMTAKISDVQALVAAVNEETNNLAARIEAHDKQQDDQIQALKDQIAGGTAVTPEQLDALASDLSAEVARLKAIGANPAEPIPPADNPPVPANG